MVGGSHNTNRNEIRTKMVEWVLYSEGYIYKGYYGDTEYSKPRRIFTSWTSDNGSCNYKHKIRGYYLKHRKQLNRMALGGEKQLASNGTLQEHVYRLYLEETGKDKNCLKNDGSFF